MADWDADSPRLRRNLIGVLRDVRDRALRRDVPAHAEWVRIHPFANENGRTARVLANALLMRYGIAPVVRLRPRPNAGYGRAAEAAMRGGWRPTAAAFRRVLSQPFTSSA